MSLTIGYSAALEQFDPAEAVGLAAYAEAHGFSGTTASDHFQPWVPQQGNASYVWNVLTAVAERTRGDFGPGVTAPTFRHHPALVAQASATLGLMYPGRHWLGIGAGEALSEHIVGQYWPEAPERINRMFEAVEVIKLFASGIRHRDVKHDGRYFKLESTRLWSMPETAPEILIATGGPVTAKRAGRTADGLITTGAPVDKLGPLLERFAEGRRESGRSVDSAPRVLQLHLSWAATEEEALGNALTEWPNGGMRFLKADLRSPWEFEQLAKTVRPEDFEGRLLISADPEVHRMAIQEYVDLGFDRIYLHNVGRNQREWIDVFGRDVLPKVVQMSQVVAAWAPDGIPEIAPGADLAQLIGDALANDENGCRDGDILVVTSKILSKAEGRIVEASDREAAITAETVRVVATRAFDGGVTRIVENRLGIVGAAAGVDASNTAEGTVLLLPVDPDASARALAAALRERFGVRLGVIVSDTLGRAWRIGQTDIAIGAAGVHVIDDLRGSTDAHGEPLSVTIPVVADELAGLGDLVKGKSSGRPVAVVRGMGRLVTDEVDTPGARTLPRTGPTDMFRLGTDEAYRLGAEGLPLE